MGRDRRSAVRRPWVPLIVAVVAVSVAAAVRWDAVQLLGGDRLAAGFWVWVERVSWLAGLGAFSLAFADKRMIGRRREPNAGDVPGDSGGASSRIEGQDHLADESGTRPIAASASTSDRYSDICARFLQVYEWHGIGRGEIPDFLKQCDGPSMTLFDLSDRDRILKRLDAPLLDFTEQIFALNRDWLRRDDASHILQSVDFYKSIGSLADFLLVGAVCKAGRSRLWRVAGYESMTSAGGTLHLLSSEIPSFDDPQAISVGGIYRVPIVNFRGRLVHRYWPIRALPWDYWKSRFDIVAMASIAHECGGGGPIGVLASPSDVFELCDGQRFPTEIVKASHSARWTPRYPYLSPNAWSGQPDYEARWSAYQDYFKQCALSKTIADAQEARRIHLITRYSS